MARRHGMSRSGSRKSFTKHGLKTHKYNLNAPVMRGGIRL